MLIRSHLLKLALLLVFFPAVVRAYYSPLVFLPGSPTAGQQFTLRAGFGICDILVVSGSDDREVVVQGSQVRVTVTGVYAPDLPFCIYPDGYADFDLGPLPSGTYNVQLYRRDLFVPSDVDLVQSGTVVVRAAPALPVPSSHPVGLIALAVFVLLFGGWAARRRFA